jgi:hypothetical protein
MKKIVIVLLVIIIGLLTYLVFKPKQIIITPTGQTTTTNNLNGSDYLPPSTTTTTPEQKKYSGNGFTVDYPALYSIEDNGTFVATLGAKAVNFITGDPNDTTSEFQTQYIVFIKDGISTNEALATYTKGLIKHENGDQSFPITEKTVTLTGRTGLQYSYKAVAGGYDGTVYVTAVVHNQKAYIIQFVNGTTSNYMKFVASFSFID